ncbi:MAG: DUF3943 domain-containing protein, partial [Myxococcaceae bacterium]|nr:DUF3943 domain-containing protein [Myxococcaceae bacterium]
MGCLFAAAPGWAAAPGEENERDALIQPTSGGPNYLAAAGLIGFVLGAGSTWYAYSPDTNAKDWLYDYSWETLKKKLITGEAIQLDDNPLFLNSPGHPLAGTVYYLVARYNRFPAWASFLITNFASFAWELATEFREEMSINDVLMTPVGGFAFGESLYSFTDFFWSARPRADNPALSDFFLPLQRPTAGSGFGPPLRSARILDGAGYPADTWYRFNVSLGAEGHKSPQVGFCSHWGLEGALIKSAAYDRPATLSRGFATPFATRLQLQLSLGERGVDRGRIRAEVAYLGLYGQQ